MNTEPLASLIRPKTLDDIFGQDEILSPGKLLRRMIEADMLSSIILYGPPGTGKTTIANIIANMTHCDFKAINATTAGKADMKAVIDTAMAKKAESNTRTILFIDEIHRFNKAQQDYLLPYVEIGTVILIGATTENPYFEINNALLSRSQIFMLKPLEQTAMKKILDRAVLLLNTPKTADKPDFMITPDAENFLINAADGDARQLLNAIDLAYKTTNPDKNKLQIIDINIAAECIQKKIKRYDKNSDNHYDAISAFIESTKHSEIDAALYYLARMIDRGEDPKYIARRLIVLASCDVGPGCPQALDTAVSAFLAVERVGLPECIHALVEATIIIAMAPKSHTARDAYAAALEDAQNLSNIEIPDTLKDESYKSAHKLGHGGVSDVIATDLKYDAFECMPDELINKRYYYPGETGLESNFAEKLRWQRAYKRKLNRKS